jgi:cytochrome c
MKKVFAALLIVTLVVSFAYAQATRGTAAEAKALLDKAVAFYKANGEAKAFAAFNDPKGQFVSKDLYIFALDMTGKVIAHGVNPGLIGKDLSKTPDADGKFFMNEMVKVAKTKGHGSVDYKWENKVTKKVEPKSSYVQKVADNVVLGCGYYK